MPVGATTGGNAWFDHGYMLFSREAFGIIFYDFLREGLVSAPEVDSGAPDVPMEPNSGGSGVAGD